MVKCLPEDKVAGDDLLDRRMAPEVGIDPVRMEVGRRVDVHQQPLALHESDRHQRAGLPSPPSGGSGAVTGLAMSNVGPEQAAANGPAGSCAATAPCPAPSSWRSRRIPGSADPGGLGRSGPVRCPPWSSRAPRPRPPGPHPPPLPPPRRRRLSELHGHARERGHRGIPLPKRPTRASAGPPHSHPLAYVAHPWKSWQRGRGYVPGLLG